MHHRQQYPASGTTVAQWLGSRRAVERSGAVRAAAIIGLAQHDAFDTVCGDTEAAAGIDPGERKGELIHHPFSSAAAINSAISRTSGLGPTTPSSMAVQLGQATTTV